MIVEHILSIRDCTRTRNGQIARALYDKNRIGGCSRGRCCAQRVPIEVQDKLFFDADTISFRIGNQHDLVSRLGCLNSRLQRRICIFTDLRHITLCREGYRREGEDEQQAQDEGQELANGALFHVCSTPFCMRFGAVFHVGSLDSY